MAARANLSSQSMIEGIESRRQQLEENAAKLRKALQHWQKWEAEYEGLKEEISALPSDATSEDLLRVSQEYESDVLNKKEIRDILGLDKGVLRTPFQVSGLLKRRIDYVQRNADGVAKQLEDVENRIEQIDTEQRTSSNEEEGLPVADIIELIDDDGNVTASHISKPEEDKIKLASALEKLGLSLGPLKEPEPQQRSTDGTQSQSAGPSNTHESTPPISADATHEQSLTTAQVNAEVTDEIAKKAVRSRKKSVSFAEGTKAEAPAAPVFSRKHLPPGSTLDPDAQATIADVINGTFKPTDRVLELDDDDNIVAASVPEIPENESPADARKRREMLQYSLSEVGAVVAELDIEEGSTDSDYSTADTEDDEDERGMSLNSRISDSYREEMLELERRLNATVKPELNPSSKLPSSNTLVNGATDARIKSNGESASQSPEKPATSKSVRFANSVEVPLVEPKDIKHNGTKSTSTSPHKQNRPAVRDIISERPTDSSIPQTALTSAGPVSKAPDAKKNSNTDASSETPPVKISRFKASRKN